MSNKGPESARVLRKQPPRRIFGRPLLDGTGKTVIEIESAVQEFMARFSGQHGAVYVSGTPESETLVNQVVAIVLGRLQKCNRKYEVMGRKHRQTDAPARPKSDVAVLIDAPTFSGWMAWRNNVGPRLVILTGEIEDWKLFGVSKPDFLLMDTSDSEKISTYREKILAAAHSSNPSFRAAVIACALGVDIPRHLIVGDDDDCASIDAETGPLVQTEDRESNPSGLISVRSPWLARDILGRERKIAAQLFADLDNFASQLTLMPDLWDRLAYLRRLRRFKF